MAVEPYRLTATEVRAKIQAGELTVEAYARSLLAHIEKRDPIVKAWEYLDPEQVKETRCNPKRPARTSPRRRGRGQGYMPTQHGSVLYKDSTPQVDAASIIVLRDAGALLLGKTTTTEFAATVAGPKTINPHTASSPPPPPPSARTGGSTIRPASFNGIYALKPTWNAISREGQKIYSLILDTLGLFARSVEDLQLLADVFALADDETPTETFDVKGAKIAFLKTMVWPHVGSGTEAALGKAVELLRAHGAEVQEIEFAAELDGLPEWHATVLHSEGRVNFLPEYRVGKEELHEFLVGHVDNVNKISRAAQLEAFDNIGAARPKVDKMLGAFDAVLVPSAVDEAPEGLGSTGSAAFNAPWTALHVPVVNLIGFGGPNGMPVGVSLVAPRYRDRHLLSVAKAVGKIFEAKGGWKSQL
uniref:Glutamyl-tRNA amidotransferase subunit a n=1 Tax=Colletotrichum fructicola (strain Nara gc5) TaxID=1213859 RepID=L2G3T6_COLFN